MPVLVHLAGIDPHAAVPLSLAIIGAASVYGAAASARRGNLAGRAAFLVGGGGIAGSRLGAALSPRVPDHLLLVFFALIMAASGVFMWRRSRIRTAPEEQAGEPRPGRAALRLLPIGLVIGLLTGVLGVGGGFLIVPALTVAGGLDMKRATGTSLAVIAVNSAAGLWGHAQGGRIHFGDAALYVAMAVLGMAGGLRLARHLPARRLQQTFAAFVLVMAAVIGSLNLSRFVAAAAGGPR